MFQQTSYIAKMIALSLFAVCITGFAAVAGSNWREAKATIDAVEKMEDGSYAYTLVYKASESTAVNAAGEKIKGPIIQQIFGLKSQPELNQTVKVRYQVDEPIVYELIGELKVVAGGS